MNLIDLVKNIITTKKSFYGRKMLCVVAFCVSTFILALVFCTDTSQAVDQEQTQERGRCIKDVCNIVYKQIPLEPEQICVDVTLETWWCTNDEAPIDIVGIIEKMVISAILDSGHEKLSEVEMSKLKDSVNKATVEELFDITEDPIMKGLERGMHTKKICYKLIGLEKLRQYILNNLDAVHEWLTD